MSRDTRAISLNEFDVVYFGNDWFAENRTSSHHIAERLAQRTRVLYVDSPGLRAPKANGRDIRRIWRKLREAARTPRRIGSSMWHISLPQIPFRRLPFVPQLNVGVGRALVARAITDLGFRRAISWFAVPHPGALAGAFDEALIVYYCIDDYAALPDVDGTMVTQMDAELTDRADLVFVASSRLLEAKRRRKPSAVHAPHGVDQELFRAASSASLPIAEGARTLKHPIIGFYGLIEAWIDLSLLAYLARRRPDWTLLLIGRVAVDVGELRRLPNVVFAGPQAYRTLPGWAKAFDVAIIPYKQTRQVVHSAPLKLREYLATGKPIVTVSAPEIDQFAHLVRTARTPDEFVRQIEDALEHDSPADRAHRIDSTKDMTWDARVRDVTRMVEERIREKEYASA